MATANTKKTATKRNIKTSTAKKAVAAKAAPKKAAPEKAAKAPKVNPHVEAGVDANAYDGLSKWLNANRKVKVRVVGERDLKDMTPRLQSAIYQMRKSYGGKQFAALGWDNGVLRDLIASGLISYKGGSETTIGGQPYLVDGESPLMLNVTTKGQSYGKTA